MLQHCSLLHLDPGMAYSLALTVSTVSFPDLISEPEGITFYYIASKKVRMAVDLIYPETASILPSFR